MSQNLQEPIHPDAKPHDDGGDGGIGGGGGMLCTNCGTVNSTEARFCTKCGQSLEPIERRITKPLPLVPGGVGAQVPPRRKGPNVGLIVGALLLIVVLVGSGLFFLVKARGITLTATPTATPGIGVPVVGGKWRLTVEKVHQETQLSGGIGINTTTYTPNSGYTFLVVDIKLRELDSPQFVWVSIDMFAIISQDGKITTAALIGLINAGTGYAGVIGTSGSNELNLSVAFVVPQGSIGQVFKLRFQQLPLIPFSAK